MHCWHHCSVARARRSSAYGPTPIAESWDVNPWCGPSRSGASPDPRRQRASWRHVLVAATQDLALDVRRIGPLVPSVREAGWNVVQVDLQHGDDLSCGPPPAAGRHPPVLRYHRRHHRRSAVQDFSVSGAQYWPEKDADGRTGPPCIWSARCSDAWTLQPDFWALENPVGRIARLVPSLGSPLLSFDPWEYAGWGRPTPADLARLASLRAVVPAGPFTADGSTWCAASARTQAHALWGSFRLPVRRPVEPVQTSSQGSWLPVARRQGSGPSTSAASPRPDSRWRSPQPRPDAPPPDADGLDLTGWARPSPRSGTVTDTQRPTRSVADPPAPRVCSQRMTDPRSAEPVTLTAPAWQTTDFKNYQASLMPAWEDLPEKIRERG